MNKKKTHEAVIVRSNLHGSALTLSDVTVLFALHILLHVSRAPEIILTFATTTLKKKEKLG